MPLLISPVVMFQAQNRETIVSTWKVAVSFKIIMTTSISRLFHSTTSDLQEQDHSVQDQDRFFFISDRSCPKTDGLWPHHYKIPSQHWYSGGADLTGALHVLTAISVILLLH